MAEFTARKLDLDAVKALSHPLRVRLFDKLSELGPLTASKLGELLGESSGATSYHLRQLAKHGLVREVEGAGTARERWWERVPGPIMIGGPGDDDTPAMRAVVDQVAHSWNELHAENIRNYERHSAQLPLEWTQLSDFSTTSVYLPREALAALVDRYHELLEEVVAPYRGTQQPGTRPVQIQFNAFALIGGREVSE